MHGHQTSSGGGSGLQTPLRNNYFYGQLLGVHNFELETSYAIRQRRTLNRLVFGHGVVCGLDVEVADDGRRVRITPGLAIDGWGQEIVVPHLTTWRPIPDQVIEAAVDRAGDCKEDACVQVLICHHECRGDPVVALAGDCETVEPCAPSTIREEYRLEFRPECPDPPQPVCRAPNIIAGGRIDQEALAKWVTRERSCTDLPRDPCVPLANVAVIDAEGTPRCDPGGVDISARPVLASNLVLRELILALLGRERQQY